MLEFQHAYRRHLPHIQPPGAIFFVTYRLAGSLPTAIQEQLLAEAYASTRRLNRISDPQERSQQAYVAQKRQFAQWDKALDMTTDGFHWLRQPEIAQIVINSLHDLDGKRYQLESYSLMSNHVHVVFRPQQKEDGTYHSLSAIMHAHKRYTAWQANQVLGRQGQFWQHESYDHIIRDEAEMHRIQRYVLDNPVKAGLVEHWKQWPWSFCRSSLQT
ncbi:MAG: transposase [Anaerolineales bacterium]|nr:transposase [Anaerolineales bacterium]